MYLQENNIKTIVSYMANLPQKSNTSFLLFLAEQNAPNLDKLTKELNSLGICFFGGVFPSLIKGNMQYESGLIIQELPTIGKPLVIDNLKQTEKYLKSIKVPQSGKRLTQLVLVDGVANGVSNFLFEMYNHLGNSVNFLGAGAGSITFNSKPCLFSNKGVFKDAAITCLLDAESKLGVRHGWRNIDGPFVATKTDGNTIIEINWEPAFPFYQKLIKENSGNLIKQNNFFETSRSYPFGIYKEGSEFIVRDPIKINNNEITCIGDVPENAILYLLNSDTKSLHHAAGSTFESQKEKLKNPQKGLVFDCISRALFLGNEFTGELNAIDKSFQQQAPGIKAEGALTLGEIALNGRGNLELFNKTIVTGILSESVKQHKNKSEYK